MGIGDRKDTPGRLGRFFGGGAGQEPPAGPETGVERRSGKRVAMPIPVRVRIGSDEQFRAARVRDVNQPGVSVEPAFGARVGDRVTLAFDGFPGQIAACSVQGQVVRLLGGSDGAMGIKVDRKASDPDALRDYRALLLHYMRHKPLLQDVGKGYFQGRCTACGWVGRVGQKTPRCPQCGKTVEPI